MASIRLDDGWRWEFVVKEKRLHEQLQLGARGAAPRGMTAVVLMDTKRSGRIRVSGQIVGTFKVEG